MGGSDDRRRATPEEARAALDRAIEERPGEVLDFVERLDRANAVLDTTSLATSAIDDDLVAGLAETSSMLLGGTSGASGSPATLAAAVGANAGDLERALRKLSRLERNGTLDELADAGETLRRVEDALDDDAVELASDPEVVADVGRLLRAVERAGDADDVGTLGALRALRDEEVQRGLAFLIGLARALGESDPDAVAGPPTDE